MTAEALVARLRARGIALEPDGVYLLVHPASAVLPDEVDALRQHKPEILVLLTRSHGAGTAHPSVARRAHAFRTQVETYWRQLAEHWPQAKHLPIPPLVLPGVVAAPGTCELCGEPITPGRTYRCSPCVEAINLVLAELSNDPR